jgi:hypothetical protein
LRKSLKVVLATCLMVALMALAAPAFAQQGSSEQPPRVAGKRITKGGNGPNVAPGFQERGATSGAPSVLGEVLPFTGADLTLFVLVAAGAVGVGTVMVRSSRVRRAEA